MLSSVIGPPPPRKSWTMSDLLPVAVDDCNFVTWHLSQRPSHCYDAVYQTGVVIKINWIGNFSWTAPAACPIGTVLLMYMFTTTATLTCCHFLFVQVSTSILVHKPTGRYRNKRGDPEGDCILFWSPLSEPVWVEGKLIMLCGVSKNPCVNTGVIV